LARGGLPDDTELGGAAGMGGMGGMGGVAGTGGAAGGGGVYPQALVHPPAGPAMQYLHVPWPVTDHEQVAFFVPLSWRATASRPAPADLIVEMEGVDGPLLQIFSLREQPFARAGLEVMPLRAEAEYRLEVFRQAEQAWLRLVQTDIDWVVLTSPAVSPEGGLGEGIWLATARQRARVHLGDVVLQPSP